MRYLILVVLLFAVCNLYAHPIPDSLFNVSSHKLYHENGELERIKLKGTASIQDFPSTHWTWFRENGSLSHTVLAETYDWDGKIIPEGSTVFLDTTGTIDHFWLSKNTIIDGVPCDGGWGKITTSFHPNGKLKWVFLYVDAEIQGIPCRHGMFSPVTFHKNGTLKGCTSIKETSINGITYPVFTVLEFDDDGELVNAEIKSWAARFSLDLLDLIF